MSHRIPRTLATIFALTALMALLTAASASAEFGLKELDTSFEEKDGSAALQAGSHPYAFTTTFGVNTTIVPEAIEDPKTHLKSDGEVPDGEVKDLLVMQIPGFAGNPTAVPRCSLADFNTRTEGRPACSDASAIGLVAVKAEFNIFPPDTNVYVHVPVYNLVPGPGEPARFGFVALNVPIVIDANVSPEAPNNIVARIANVPQALLFYGSRFTLWGNPANPGHDEFRGDCLGEPVVSTAEPVSLGKCPVNVEEAPFLTMPRACEGPLSTVFTADPWATPGAYTPPKAALTHDSSGPLGMQGCSKLGFAPETEAKTTTTSAESSSGLDFAVKVKDQGLTSPTGTANSDIKALKLSLPEGMTANPSSADGLGVCSPADLQRETIANQGCPDASKLGTIEAKTPLLQQTLGGSLYLAKPYENPFGSLLALYLVIKNPELGILVKQAVKVEPDPKTGQLVSTATDIPQFPLSRIAVHFREGARSPLVTPPACGTYAVKAELTPWAGGSVLARDSSFTLSSGAGAGPCPSAGTPPFKPGFEAGSINNNAGSFSPFYMRLTRRDGDQDLTKFSARLPKGMVASLAGTSNCPEASIAAARARSGPHAGAEELASPSCPASSQIGRVMAGAGVGEALTYVPGKVYLAGPYNGAPLSVVAIVPAVAGPFDVGVVTTRIAARIDPRSAEVNVDGSASDPIPHILAGIPLKVRDIRVYVDRPRFTINPTSCDPSQVTATLWGGGANPFSLADDSPLSVDSRFQVAGCAGLGFKPTLSLKLTGGTKRGQFPALRGEYRPRPGDANLAGLVLRLPHSAFLEQSHIGTICTRPQFAAEACPQASIYGSARAFTPVLDQPLEGPVYLRSSSNPLPDFVADLKGQIDVEAVARIDSKNAGIRATFTDTPDAPLSKVVVSMRGGKKGLIVNSTDLCARTQRANATFNAHNGARAEGRPVVRAVGCGKGRGKAGRK